MGQLELVPEANLRPGLICSNLDGNLHTRLTVACFKICSKIPQGGIFLLLARKFFIAFYSEVTDIHCKMKKVPWLNLVA